MYRTITASRHLKVLFLILCSLFLLIAVPSSSLELYSKPMLHARFNTNTSSEILLLEKKSKRLQKKTNSKKVLFILPHLVCGGLDKGFIDMLNFLPRKKSEYDVCILKRGGAFECFLPAKTHVISLKNAQKLSYNSVVSYAQWINPKLWVNKIRTNKYVQWLHADLKTIGGSKLAIQNPKKRKGIDVFVGVSKTATKSIADTFGSLKKKCLTIRNCVNDQEIIARSLEPQNEIVPGPDRMNLLTVCRISAEKRLDRLIKVHGQLNQAGVNFHWYFVGDGAMRNDLEKLAAEQGLSNKVHFLGSKLNPYPYIKAADLFVLGSDSESWGIVITEAMILHRPILSTDVGGALEQISSDVNGLIVERNEKSLFNGIKCLVESQATRDRYVKALENFHYDNATPIRKLQKLLFPDKSNKNSKKKKTLAFSQKSICSS